MSPGGSVDVLKVVKTHSKACFVKATEGAAGFDLCYAGEKPIKVFTGQIALVPTGIKVEIPQGYAGVIKDRSGRALKQGLHVLAGVIDSDYRGEVNIVLINLGPDPVVIEPGERVAQMVVVRIYDGPVLEVEEKELSETKRGEGGFGSTGLQ